LKMLEKKDDKIIKNMLLDNSQKSCKFRPEMIN